MAVDGVGPAPEPAAQLETLQQETRFELRLLHDRVNSLLAAEAFLTIAYTATGGRDDPWARTVATALSVLGLLLALLAQPGVGATARLVAQWTARTDELLAAHPEVAPLRPNDLTVRRRGADQRRSLLFFRSVPLVFTALWIVLLVVALR